MVFSVRKQCNLLTAKLLCLERVSLWGMSPGQPYCLLNLSEKRIWIFWAKGPSPCGHTPLFVSAVAVRPSTSSGHANCPYYRGYIFGKHASQHRPSSLVFRLRFFFFFASFPSWCSGPWLVFPLFPFIGHWTLEIYWSLKIGIWSLGRRGAFRTVTLCRVVTLGFSISYDLGSCHRVSNAIY